MNSKQFLRKYKKKGVALATAIDNFGNFLSENPPDWVSEELTDTFQESLKALGQMFVDYTAMMLLEKESKKELKE